MTETRDVQVANHPAVEAGTVRSAAAALPPGAVLAAGRDFASARRADDTDEEEQ